MTVDGGKGTPERDIDGQVRVRPVAGSFAAFSKHPFEVIPQGASVLYLWGRGDDLVTSSHRSRTRRCDGGASCVQQRSHAARAGEQ